VPKLFELFGYVIFFWVNEGTPTEPVHVHVAKRRPMQNATKLWITGSGDVIIANNDSQIPARALNTIAKVVAARSGEIAAQWRDTFGEIHFINEQ
jgi:hypothetical protein